MNKRDLISLIWLLVLILFLRAFVVEPFKIPSGSMIPTLLVGDHLFVAKSSYDIRIPFTNISLMRVADPKRGDVVVFEFPNPDHDESKDGQFYIKRLIGLPGDQIRIEGGVPVIADKHPDVQAVNDLKPSDLPDYDLNLGTDRPYKIFREFLPGMDHPHWVQRSLSRTAELPTYVGRLRGETGKDCIEIASARNGAVPFYSANVLDQICTFTVPPDHFFMMGDNRDESSDSRDWGFVDRKLLKGRALFIWLSLLQNDGRPGAEGGPFLRWKREGLKLN